MRALPPDLRRLIAKQAGALTHAQLGAAGFRTRDAERKVAAGHWQRISSRVIAIYATPLERRTRLWAASLHHDRVGLTGTAALEWAGLQPPRDGRIDLLGPRGTRLLPFDGCRITVSATPEFIFDVGPMRTRVEESLLRAAGDAKSRRQAVFYVTWAVQRRLTTLAALHTALASLPRSPALVRADRILDLVEPGVHSMHEFDFARECRRRGLPVPQRQVQRQDSHGHPRYTDVEFTIGSRTLIVEIDGVGHVAAEVRLDDDWRENELALQHATVLRISGLALRMDRDRCFEQIARGLAQLRSG